MIGRLTFASILGSAILLAGVFSQGVVPTSSLRTPLDFGAVGDGVANDTEALQRAIDATQNGGSLYFPGGCRFLVRGLHATGEIHWLGPGGSWLSDRAVNGADIVLGDNADGDLLTLDHSADSSISGIGFDGNKAHQSKGCNGIRMINCEFTRLDNVYVTSCSGSGILFENSNTLQTSDEIDLVDCYSVLNLQDGVRFDFVGPGGLWAPGDCEILGGHYDYNTGCGVNLHVSSYTSINSANVLSNGLAGINAIYCTGLNITSNMVRNNQRQGIVLGSGPQYTDCTNCAIIGNQVHLNSRGSVGQYAEVEIGYGTSNTRVIGNYCGDVHTSPDYPVSAKCGIWLHDGAKQTVLVGNSSPTNETIGGGLIADPGIVYTASANVGINSTPSGAGAMRREHFVAAGGPIGAIVGDSSRTTWVGISGKSGGTLRLPPAANLAIGENIVIKDEGGGAAAHPILINGTGPSIDGKSTASLGANYGSLRLRYDGKYWWSW